MSLIGYWAITWLVCLHVSRGCCVGLPRGAMGLSEVSNCGIS